MVWWELALWADVGALKEATPDSVKMVWSGVLQTSHFLKTV
jgi:hypothetical protein